MVSAPIASKSAFSVTETSSWISNETNIVAKNAIGQNNIITKIKEASQQLYEYERSYIQMPDDDLRQVLTTKIEEKKKIINESKVKLERLKRRAEAQARLRAKKQKKLEEESIVEQYDKPGRPPAAISHPDL